MTRFWGNSGGAGFFFYVYNMLFRLTLFVCGLLDVVFIQAQDKTAYQETGKLRICVSTGYRVDDIRWSISGNSSGTNPNIYSELIWKNLKSASVNVNADWQFWKQFRIKTSVGQSYIEKGKVTDTDYQEDNRMHSSYYGLFNSNKGTISSAVAALGYTLGKGKIWSLTPYIGYSIVKETLYLLPADLATPINLNSTYTAVWKGLVAGGDMETAISKRVKIGASCRYYQVIYSAKANWNLISRYRHPVSFEHRANGYGIEPSVSAEYLFSGGGFLYFKTGYAYYNTGKGTDKLYLVNGQTDFTQLNGVIQKTFLANIGFGLTLGK